MISLKIDDREFVRKMNNLVNYSLGFLEGTSGGKLQFMRSLGVSMKEIAMQYIDASARSNPASLHHVYEWYLTGSPEARLYDIDCRVSNVGLTFDYSFSQSTSIKNGSRVPFYDKARIMENGIPVTIIPKKSSVLVFEDNGEQVFTRNPVTVDNPGGTSVQGGFSNIFQSFFSRYFTQAFLGASGIMSHLRDSRDFRQYVFAGMNGGGKSLGFKVGYRWIAGAGDIG